MQNEQLTQKEYSAYDTVQARILLERCQRFIEKNAENKTPAEELRGMVRLLRHIKQIPEEFEQLKTNAGI